LCELKLKIDFASDNVLVGSNYKNIFISRSSS